MSYGGFCGAQLSGSVASLRCGNKQNMGFGTVVHSVFIHVLHIVLTFLEARLNKVRFEQVKCV